jgi:transcriptional regulator with XRE-family HTH domain
MTIATEIKRLRIAYGLNQYDLADLINTPQCSVSGWETGKHVITLPLLARLVVALELSDREIAGLVRAVQPVGEPSV